VAFFEVDGLADREDGVYDMTPHDLPRGDVWGVGGIELPIA